MKSPRKLALFILVFAVAFVPQMVGCTGGKENTVVEQTTATEQTDADLEDYDNQMTQPGGI